MSSNVVVGVAQAAQVSQLARSSETYVYFPVDNKSQISLELLAHSKIDQQAAIRPTIRDLDTNLAFDVIQLEENPECWRTPSRIVAILA